MRPAAEWAKEDAIVQVEDGVWEGGKVSVDFIRAIQIDALETAAMLCEARSCGVRVTLEGDTRDDGYKAAAEECADAIRKLKPTKAGKD